ncbi:hypothetical protein [Sphingopyxis sp.]|uniref:hypothetical protein n=1 Tax=Sphingopyxis sp. TaxID=1908224 RepID=UPI001D73C2EF|nr:hypothetical protein [Sphingopyxis sp.]MBW8297322.1 hypothetical protein [Sphingopyxis sp.]
MQKPTVLSVHDTSDPVAQISALQTSKSERTRLGFDITAHVAYGGARTVDFVALRLGSDFLAEASLGRFSPSCHPNRQTQFGGFPLKRECRSTPISPRRPSSCP